MIDPLHSPDRNQSSMTIELAATLRSALDNKYGRVMRVAQIEWERNFAGTDPSDACVSVRISPLILGGGRKAYARDLQHAA